jgi:hypothetical protein
MAYLAKPFDADDLRAIVAATAARRPVPAAPMTG